MSERIKETIAFFKNHFFEFSPLFILFSFPTVIFPVLMSNSSDGQPSAFAPMLVALIMVLVSLLSLGVISFRLRAILEKSDVSFSDELGKTFRKLPALFISMVLCMLAVIAGLILLVLPGLYIMLRLSLTCYFILFDNLGAVAAMKESFRKTKAIQWELLGALIFLMLPVMLLQSGFVVAFEGMNPDAFIPAEAVVQTLLAPLSALGWIVTLRYYDIVNSTYIKSQANE